MIRHICEDVGAKNKYVDVICSHSIQYSGHYTASINCCKTYYCNDSETVEFEMIDTKNTSSAYVVMYKLITEWFSVKNRRIGVLITPMALAHPLHPI